MERTGWEWKGLEWKGKDRKGMEWIGQERTGAERKGSNFALEAKIKIPKGKTLIDKGVNNVKNQIRKLLR